MSRTDPRPHYGRKRRVRADGYVDVWNPRHPLARADGYVFEHRMVAWDAGFLVDLTNEVHHLNGDKADNRPNNLRVVSKNDHAALHARTELRGWAAENSAKTKCKHGHDLTDPDNVYVSQLPRRVCVTCVRARGRRQRA